MIERDDILHLGTLARIRIEEDEIEPLKKSINAILEYVSAVNDIARDDIDTKQVGARFNVLREDELPHEPNTHSEDLLKEMPNTEGRYMKVKKILSTE